MKSWAQDYMAVIPAYNEAGTIRAVASHTLKHLDRVVVVDDGSVDRTVDCLRELPVTVIRHPHNLGKAAALWRGMQYAMTEGATAVLTLDGDGQHDPDDIPALITMHRCDPSAIIIGARLHHRRRIPWLRLLANRVANFWVSWAAGQRIHDSQSGFRLYPTSLLNAAGSRCDPTSGFAFESEILIEAGRMGIPVRAVPVSTTYGRHLRQSHFRQVHDVARITRMVTRKLLAGRLDIAGLLKSRRDPQALRQLDAGPRVTACGRPPLRRRRILFVAEAVSLAHVARAAALAQTLDPKRFDVHLACDQRYIHLFDTLHATIRPIGSLGSEQFQDRLRKGNPLYTTDELRTYAQQDLRLLGDVKPDAVVGDFRLSLSVSARVASVPYLTVTNAHWSPYARQTFVVPELAIAEQFGPHMGQALFTLMRPFVFAHQALALNRVRKDYGLPSVGYSLPHIYTEADVTLYADLPELVPTFDRPRHHHYLGPVLWSPDSTPPWWDAVPNDRPTAYVSLGTSGRPDLLPKVVRALDHLGVTALVSTAGRPGPEAISERTWIAPYLPGLQAAARADIVICNGGSATVYQAFAAGVPVLGIPSNLDQYLMMDYVRRWGAGDYLRAGETTLSSVRERADRILHSPMYRQQAGRLGALIRSGQSTDRFESLLARVVGAEPSSTADSDQSRSAELPAPVGGGRHEWSLPNRDPGPWDSH